VSSVNYLIDKTIGRYRILEHIGHGGMSEVYKGKQSQLDRWVAVKVLHPFLADDEGFVVRFRREARIVATLRHSNIVQVFDFDYHEDLDIYYMVMEYIDGPTLKSLMSEKPLRPERAASIGAAIADALDYAHAREMIHRDIKPANVMFIDDEQPVLTDFGIAKMLNLTGLTASGAMVGTPAYMAPEVGIGKPGTAQSDMYSLSVMLYQMLTGRLPFDSETPMGMVMQHINDPPPPLTDFEDAIPPALESVILRALEKDPANRYVRAGGFASALREAAGLQGGTPSAKTSIPEVKEILPIPQEIEPPTDTPSRWVARGQGDAATPPPDAPDREANRLQDDALDAAQLEARDPIGELLTPSDELAQPRSGVLSWIGSGLAALLILSVITFAVWLGFGGRLPASLAAVMSNAAGMAARETTAVPTASPTLTATPVATATSTPTATTSAMVVLPTATPRVIPTLTPTPICNPLVRVNKIWTVPNETVPPETAVTAYVTLENSGSCAWPEGSELVLSSGKALGAPSSYVIGALAPEEMIQVVLPMQAPEASGTYTSVWKIRRADGPPFGDNAIIELSVEDLPAFTPTPVVENEIVTNTPAPLDIQEPEIVRWSEDKEQNLWSGILKLQATGGTGEYRFYYEIIRADTQIKDGVLSFEETRCKPIRLDIWILSGSETINWQAEIAYPDPEACP
jgi:serine/threonine protein kinase